MFQHSFFIRYAGKTILLAIFFLSLAFHALTQPLTGVWHGKIKKNGLAGGNEQVELKLVRDGDSLFGAAYYYHDPSRYERVPVKGYIDPWTGTVRFWEETVDGETHRGQLVFETDFNCPGEGVLLLDGLGGPRQDPGKKDITAHFQKVDGPLFEDEWDLVIRDPSLRMNDGETPGAMYRRLLIPEPRETSPPVVKQEKKTTPPRPKPEPVKTRPAPEPVVKATPPIVQPKKPLTPQEMLDTRSRRLVSEIPLVGDSILLSFYDNAEIDGDSISLFMNGKLMYEHVLLKASAFEVKIPISELSESNEMVMVAENQGSIPPNTSLMVTYVEGKRYEATLESTEGTSAMIRFYKPSGAGPVKPRG